MVIGMYLELKAELLQLAVTLVADSSFNTLKLELLIWSARLSPRASDEIAGCHSSLCALMSPMIMA